MILERRASQLWIEREEKAKGVVVVVGEAEVALWRDLPVKTGSREGYTQEIIKQRLVEGLSCSAAVKGP